MSRDRHANLLSNDVRMMIGVHIFMFSKVLIPFPDSFLFLANHSLLSSYYILIHI